MRHRELEEKLRKKLRLRRVILGISAIVLFIIGAVCSLLRESTREVIVHNYGFLIRDEIVYNNVYVPFIAIGFLGMLAAAVSLLIDFLSCRFETIEVNGYYITVYRGAVGNYVYVDGEEKGRLEMSYANHIEIALPDDTVVNFSFGRSMLEWCHISFSDGRESIDL